MPSKKDRLNHKKQTLLTELESIKGLLDKDIDNIPVLQDAIIETKIDTEEALTNTQPQDSTKTALEAEMTHNESLDTNTEIPTLSTKKNGVLPGQQSLFKENTNTENGNSGSKESLSKNPFLPPHVRQRFEGESETSEATSNTLKEPTPIDASYTERLVDQLVAHHLPKIEAELRKKLLAVIKLHNERIKK